MRLTLVLGAQMDSLIGTVRLSTQSTCLIAPEEIIKGYGIDILLVECKYCDCFMSGGEGVISGVSQLSSP